MSLLFLSFFLSFRSDRNLLLVLSFRFVSVVVFYILQDCPSCLLVVNTTQVLVVCVCIRTRTIFCLTNRVTLLTVTVAREGRRSSARCYSSLP
jgi:hypothetical protein